MIKFRTFGNLTKEELKKAFTTSLNQNEGDCIRFRSMIFGYIKKDDEFLKHHHSKCWKCQEFYMALCNIKPKQARLNGHIPKGD